VAAELADPPQAQFDDDIYGAPPDVLIDVVADLPDDAGSALLVGHNPGMQEVLGLLCDEAVEMKTASVAVLTWPGRWADVAPHTASLADHTTPRG
jgi:phosphohistidine phosphatase